MPTLMSAVDEQTFVRPRGVDGRVGLQTCHDSLHEVGCEGQLDAISLEDGFVHLAMCRTLDMSTSMTVSTCGEGTDSITMCSAICLRMGRVFDQRVTCSGARWHVECGDGVTTLYSLLAGSLRISGHRS